MTCPEPIRESDELVCRACRLRWDVSEDKPDCAKSFPTSYPGIEPGSVELTPPADDRATLEAVAKGYHDLIALQATQRETMALMLRACVKQLQSPNAVKRKEAINGLIDLADLLEKSL